MEQSEKIRISSDFIFLKLLLFGILGLIFLLLTDYKRTDSKVINEYIFISIVLSILLGFLFTRPGIYYDSQNLFIMRGARLNLEIPLENIQSIKYSVLGLGHGSYSYNVKYRDSENQIKSIRIFSGFASNPISEFINSVKKQNPNVHVTNWSFGINEFFDR